MAETRDEAGDSPSPRRPARRWRLPLALIVLTAVVGLVCAPWWLSNPGRMSRLVAGAIPELDGDVTFRQVRAGWLGPMVLEGVRIVPRDGADVPLEVARVEVSHGLAAVLASWGDLGVVRVEGLEADVVFDDAERSNLSGLFRPPARPASGTGSPRGSPLRMRLEIEDAVVRIAGPWAAEPWRSAPIDLTATLAPAADGTWSEWSIEPVDLLVDARLEPAVARSVLAYAAPILAASTRTSGRFSLRLDEARLPVGRPVAGTLSGALAMHEVVVGPGPLVESLMDVLPRQLPAPPDIRIADESRVAFRFAGGRVTHEGLEFGLPLGRAGQRLDVRSSGSVGVADGSLDLRLELPIPEELPTDRPLLATLAGKAISIGIRGSLRHPEVVFDGSIREAAGQVLGDVVDRLWAERAAGGSGADGSEAGGEETVDAILDVIGGVLDAVARERAARRAAEQADPDSAPQPRPGPRPRRRPRRMPPGDG